MEQKTMKKFLIKDLRDGRQYEVSEKRKNELLEYWEKYLGGLEVVGIKIIEL